MINITFEGQPLHDICADLGLAEQAYGSVAAAALVTFLSDARSLETVDELLDLFGDDIKIAGDDSLSVAIGADYSADLVVVGTRHSRDAGGRIVWASVTRLKIMAISRVP
ncbi:MAG: hypothetical protein KF730_13575 [Sphingomonas sp.]|uniref:hypothetical protein n=1 Tax=Sphingomonas sp. TaxID=28214 RepID=UPI0025D022FA|nr:hypothetical protein [Sphingomonas sp.]MBX3565594.1 hypothetical protein [Sphingomonas sp.]